MAFCFKISIDNLKVRLKKFSTVSRVFHQYIFGVCFLNNAHYYCCNVIF